MKAVQYDGSIVELKKECDCITHEEPHWLHMDKYYRDKNQQHLEAGNFFAYTQEEEARLVEKLRNFKRLGIIRIIIED